jgi:hypothetical protein
MLTTGVRRPGWPRAVGAIGLMVLGAGALQAQTCTNHWPSMFPGGGGFDSPVNALLVFNGELHFGGEFATCMQRTVNYVARWDGQRWAGRRAWSAGKGSRQGPLAPRGRVGASDAG